MSIQDRAVLVELNISVWTANKLDRDVSNKVSTDANASVDAGQYRKNLMAGTTKRKAIADYASGCRLWHSSRTLPWADKGQRMLPMPLFFEYKEEAKVRREVFNEMVEDFVKEYPELVSNAATHLGALYDPTDYPSADEISNRFGFRTVFSPIPESGDFRVDAPAEELQEMRDEYDARLDERLAEAMQHPWKKLHKELTDMHAKLVKATQTDSSMRWHDTFLTNPAELCSLLTHMNVTNDPKLEQARQELERAIMGKNIDSLKTDDLEQAELKDDLKVVLDKYW